MADEDDGWTVAGDKANEDRNDNPPKQEEVKSKVPKQRKLTKRQRRRERMKQSQKQTEEKTSSQLDICDDDPQSPEDSAGVDDVDRQLSQINLYPKVSVLKRKGTTKKKSDLKKPPRTVATSPWKPERVGPPPGRYLQLISNLIKVFIEQKVDIYQSGVNIDCIEIHNRKKKVVSKKLGNETRRRALALAMESFLENSRPDLLNTKYTFLSDVNASMVLTLFDVSQGDDSKKTFEFDVEIPDDSAQTVAGEYHVKLSKPVKVLLNDYVVHNDYLKVLNVIITTNYLSMEKFKLPRSGAGHTSIFPYVENQHPIMIRSGKTGIFCNRGYNISVRPTESGLVLNVANTIAPFYESCSLIDFLRKQYNVQVNRDKPLSASVVDKLKKELYMRQVYATHLNYGTDKKPNYRKYRIRDIGGSGHDKFLYVDKEANKADEITVYDYFRKVYGLTLKFPKLPCVNDNGRKVPLEFCRLVERQRVSRKMTRDETQQIIKIAALDPINHFKQVEENAREVCKTSFEPATAFGVKLDPKLIEVDGRELPQISMKAGANRVVETSRGQYDVRDMEFFRPTARIQSWAICFLRGGRFFNEEKRQELATKTREIFCKEYRDAARKRGVSLKPVKTIDFIPRNTGDVEIMHEEKLRRLLDNYYIECNQKKYDHVIFILTERCPDWVYGYLQFLEASVRRTVVREWWTRSSCLKLKNFEAKILADPFKAKMFISNLWLKYNTKMDGTNFVLNIKPNDPVAKHFRTGYLYVAVDVCHPAPGDRLTQSVAAVVGMWDLTGPNGIGYCTRIRVQIKEREKKSTIEHVLEIHKMYDEILESYKKSKGCLPTHVVILRDGVSEGQFEIVLTEELTRLQQVSINKARKSLPMTCFVVQKRHKIRFRLKNPIGDSYNIPPGTVVDKDVTHPEEPSFYIAPHKAIQGTARAAYIYMIFDEIGFTQDEAQALIFLLSYLSPRCTKGTSIPTPVNLADRAAERGKNLVISWNSINTTRIPDEDRIKLLNHFLSTMGDENYRHTLFYI